MSSFAFSATFTPDETDGGCTVTTDKTEVGRLFDPRYGTKIPTIERALHALALGKHAELHVE
jgi:hypothetical protein